MTDDQDQSNKGEEQSVPESDAKDYEFTITLPTRSSQAADQKSEPTQKDALQKVFDVRKGLEEGNQDAVLDDDIEIGLVDSELGPSEYDDDETPQQHLDNIDKDALPEYFSPKDPNFKKEEHAYFKINGGIGPVGLGANSYIYGDYDTQFMIDFGESLNRVEGYDKLIPNIEDFRKIKALFTTHSHVDHIAGLVHLPALGVDTSSINIYGMPETREIYKLNAIMARTPYSRWEKFNANRSENCDLDPGGITPVDDWMIEARHIRHSIQARSFLMTAPNGVKIFHTGDMRMSAGIEDDEDYLDQLMDAGAQADFVVMDVTHADISGANKDVETLKETYDEYFDSCEGARINIATLSSSLPTIAPIVDAALKKGRHVIFHGFYGASSAKLYKKAGFQYSELESGAGEGDVPLVMDSEEPDVAKLPPEKTVVIMTGQYMEPNSRFMEFARGAFDAKYRMPPPDAKNPEKEIFLAVRGPYPNMKAEWKNMRKGIAYILKRGWRMDMHGVDAGPWEGLKKEFPALNLREFSGGGHMKFYELLVALATFVEGARRKGRPPPVIIPHHTDYRGLDKMHEIFKALRYPHKIVLPGQRIALSLSKDKTGKLIRNVYCLNKNKDLQPARLIGAKQLGVDRFGDVNLEKSENKYGGAPYQYDLLEWDEQEQKMLLKNTIIDHEAAQAFIKQIKIDEGHSPATYLSREAMLDQSGLNLPLSYYMQNSPKRPVSVRMGGEFYKAAGRKKNGRNVNPTFVEIPAAEKDRLPIELPKKKRPLRKGGWNKETKTFDIKNPDSQLVVKFSPEARETYLEGGQKPKRRVRIVTVNDEASIHNEETNRMHVT